MISHSVLAVTQAVWLHCEILTTQHNGISVSHTAGAALVHRSSTLIPARRTNPPPHLKMVIPGSLRTSYLGLIILRIFERSRTFKMLVLSHYLELRGLSQHCTRPTTVKKRVGRAYGGRTAAYGGVRWVSILNSRYATIQE